MEAKIEEISIKKEEIVLFSKNFTNYSIIKFICFFVKDFLREKLKVLKANKKIAFTPKITDLTDSNLGFPNKESKENLLNPEFSSSKYLLNDLIRNEHLRHNDKKKIKV